MSYAAEQLLALMPAVVRRQCVATLRELISSFRILPNAGVLEQIQSLVDFLDNSGLVLIPPVFEGDPDTPRTLVFSTETSTLADSEITSLIQEGEGNRVEFKSTFFIDLKKLRNAPDLPVKEYKSDDVTHSAMKTIAAFLNCDGGTLLVGVADDGEPCGLATDHLFPATSNEDKWQLAVRSTIASQFKDGKAINAYVTIDFRSLGGHRVAVFRILPRPTTVYLKFGNEPHALFARNGNRTDKLDISQAEDFFRLKWERLQNTLA